MSAVQQAVCTCGSIGADPKAVTFCAEHHRYRRGDKELVSVTKVLGACWPVKPDYSAAPPEVLENARERGVIVDSLVSPYVEGRLAKIPAGTRTDAVELFWKFKEWWDAQRHQPQSVRSQVIVADDNVAGQADIVPPESIYDLKTTYAIEPKYALQLGAYADLAETTLGARPEYLGIIHLTARQPVKLIRLNVDECVRDWRMLRAVWMMAQVRIAQK